MKAAVINQFGDHHVFEIIDVPEPIMYDDQLLIKVLTHSINPIDWKQRKGNHKLILGSPFPIILGYDVCGEVVKTGSNITRFKKGDIVFGVLDNKYGGALAEYAVGHENSFAVKPENITINEAAAFPMVSVTVLQTFRDKAQVKPGQTILINGASGGIGHMAVQLAKIFGTKVIAVASGKSKDFVSQFLPDQFFDYTKQNILEMDQKVDLFVDVAGNYSFLKTKHLLNPGGIYFNLEYINTIKRMPVNWFFQLFTKGKKVKTLLMKHNSNDFDFVAKLISENKLKVSIDKTFTLEQISEAHQYAQLGHNKGKNVVVISS